MEHALNYVSTPKRKEGNTHKVKRTESHIDHQKEGMG